MKKSEKKKIMWQMQYIQNSAEFIIEDLKKLRRVLKKNKVFVKI